MRRLCAAVLTCEAIVIVLAIPVAITVLGARPGVAGGVCGGLAVACLVLAGLLRFRWALLVGHLLQLLVIATGFLVPAMFFLGVLFGALWATAIWLGHKVEEPQAR